VSKSSHRPGCQGQSGSGTEWQDTGTASGSCHSATGTGTATGSGSGSGTVTASASVQVSPAVYSLQCGSDVPKMTFREAKVSNSKDEREGALKAF
jgi:hypothetical protein